jgi:hypothetical protein
VEEFFTLWAAQPRCALAVHTLTDEDLAAAAAAGSGGSSKVHPGSAGGSAAGAAGAAGPPQWQRLQGLAVCWGLQETFFLELTGQQLLVCIYYRQG